MLEATNHDRSFTGSIPEIYDSHLVPLIFDPYAIDLASRLAKRPLASLLELAAGTGAVTRRLARELPDSDIVATDLNQQMIDRASAVGTARPVTWKQADAQRLPFPDASFDAVVCQFGVMFFPDKAAAFAEARRVLKRGGIFLFNVWDRIETNGISAAVCAGLASVFPEDPPRFLARTPHGYHDFAAIRRDLAAGGFTAEVRIDTVDAIARAATPRVPAVGFCHGSPVRNEIEARDAARLEEATGAAEREIARRFGTGPLAVGIRAHVVTALRD